MNNVIWEKKSVISKSLRPYQIKAIEKSINYIKSDSSKQALIKMPTGTGKTIVIGILSTFIKSIDNVLIVTPSEAIRSQVYHEIKHDLWNKINLELEHNKMVYQLFPRNLSALNQLPHGKIFITTIQALTKIKNENIEEYSLLRTQINLVLFDEGHREPAPSWSNAIRELEKKTILFSATPIRNDHQIFNVDENHFFNYTLSEAINEEIIRDIDFKVVNLKDFSLEHKLKEFLNNVILYRETFIRENNFEPKVILRFNNVEDITKALAILEEKEESVIAIHDRFKETKESEKMFQSVPSSNHEGTYWLHQNKLIEGIDDSKFAILAIYGNFDNARSLIQQIGRIIRRKEDEPKKGIVIINNEGSFQKEVWETFYETEKNTLSSANKLPAISFKKLFNDLMKIQPQYIYEAKKFLKKYDYKKALNDEDIYLKYKLPLKTNIFSLKHTMNLRTTQKLLLQNLFEEKKLNNEIIIQSYTDETSYTNLIVYSKYNNSPLLNDESFIEVKLGICYFGIYNNFLFFYDTNNKIPACIFDFSHQLESDALSVVFDQDSEFTEVTLKNGSISHNNVKRQVINSRDLKEVAPNMTDKYNFCTTITARVFESGKKRKRYVGFTNSRISENSTNVVFRDYIDWIKSISQLISQGQRHQDTFFNRYAANIDIPKNTTPISFLLDLHELEDNIINQEGEPVYIENLYYKIKNNKFDLTIGGETLPITIYWTGDKYQINFVDAINNKKYKFNTEIITDEYSIKPNDTLIKFLNKYQSFQIITEDIMHIYYKKRFYKNEISKDDNRIHAIFDEYSLIDNKQINSEKGDLNSERSMWSEDSLFYLVASSGKDIDETEKESFLKQSLMKMDYLICTDLNKEIADFIGINEKDNQVYFIHCKAKAGTYSASNFQEICAQVVKNLDYAHPLSTRTPNDVETWNEDWKVKNVTTNRIIKGNLSSEEVWKKLKEIQLNPNSTTNVWALTGKMFSLETYMKQKDAGVNQYPEIIQLDYLLMNTLTATQAAGAKFRVFFDKK